MSGTEISRIVEHSTFLFMILGPRRSASFATRVDGKLPLISHDLCNYGICTTRSDTIEVLVEDDFDGQEQLNDVADVLIYIESRSTGKKYAVIRYYTVLPGIGENGYLHHKLMVPRVKTRDPTLCSTYACLEVTQITAYAHLVPDFDDPVDDDGVSKCFFWDKHDS